MVNEYNSSHSASKGTPAEIAALLLIAMATLLGCRLLGASVLGDFPNSADEFAYLYQAHTFAQGRAWVEAHPLQEALSPFFILTYEGKVFSIFPPGWPIVLSAGVLQAIEWWINPLWASLTVLMVWALGMRLEGRKTAWGAVLLMSASPMFAFNGASLFSHSFCLFLVTVTAWLLMRWIERGRPLDAIAAGAAAAWMFTVREYTAALMLAPLIATAYFMSPSKWKFAAWIAVGAAPALSGYLMYNAALTGQWLTPARFMMESERLGFGERTIRVFDYVEVQTFTPLDAFAMMARNLGRLFVWTAPGLPLIAAWGVWRNRREGWIWALAASSAALPIGYLLYPAEGGNQYGPRFYFEGAAFMALLGARGLTLLPLRRFGVILAAAAIVSLPVWAYWVDRHSHQIRLRKTLYILVEHRNLQNALVFVGAPSGDMTQGDLIRNMPPLDNQPVIYAWDLGAQRNQALREAFPDRDAFFFGRDARTGVWYLERIL